MSTLPRIHRRSPCPCGSLRPLAGCCLPWEEAFQQLTARLAAFAGAPGVRRLESRAAVVFSDPKDPESGLAERAAERYPGFAEWFLQDYAAGRRGPLLGEFADHALGLSPHEECLLRDLLLTPIRAYEVTEGATPGGIQVKDLLAGTECLVGPLGLPDGVIRSDICVARLVPAGRLRRPGISLLRLPPGSQAEMLAYLRATYRMARPGRHLSLEDFLDGEAHLYHQFFLHRGRTLGGRAQRTCRWAAFIAGRAVYEGEETARIRAALDRQPDLERTAEDAEGVSYAWIDSMQGIRRGTVRVGQATIQATAWTGEDLEGIKQALESRLRGLVRLVEEQQDPPPVAPKLDPSPAKSGLAGTAFLRRVLAQWPDTPAPLLADRTPRGACGSQAGREQVKQLLLGLERDLARQKRIGRPWVEIGTLWEELALPAPSGRGPAPA